MLLIGPLEPRMPLTLSLMALTSSLFVLYQSTSWPMILHTILLLVYKFNTINRDIERLKVRHYCIGGNIGGGTGGGELGF
jgi:hypothetical protein